MVYAMVVLNAVVGLGAVAIWLLTGGDFTFGQALYFTLITVSTVGFGEPVELERYPGTHAVIGGLIVAGVMALAFFESTMTAMLVEGVILRAVRERRMKKKMKDMNNHYVVAGCGRTGRHCVGELMALGRQVVVIDQDQELLEHVNETYFGGELLYVHGDATEDHALLEAGVASAKGLVAALTDDRDNVFVVLSSRSLNPKLTIAAKSLEQENEPKLRKAGADRIVSPYRIGGFRLASELVRPRSVTFLDSINAMSGQDLQLEDIELKQGTALDGRTLRESAIRDKTNALIVAVAERDGTFVQNPKADHVLTIGSHLVAVGTSACLKELRKLAHDE
jgi:voltage-gated potassium channel